MPIEPEDVVLCVTIAALLSGIGGYVFGLWQGVEATRQPTPRMQADYLADSARRRLSQRRAEHDAPTVKRKAEEV